MTQLETLQEIHDWTKKGLHKAETELEAHQTGRWAPGESYVRHAEERVEKWTRWRDTIAKLIENELRATTTGGP
jgi:hypothetical protein